MELSDYIIGIRLLWLSELWVAKARLIFNMVLMNAGLLCAPLCQGGDHEVKLFVE